MVFMIAFIPLSLPVAWLIDKYGYRKAVSVGAILMGIFGVLRGLAGTNYSFVLLSTIGIAIAQPFFAERLDHCSRKMVQKRRKGYHCWPYHPG